MTNVLDDFMVGLSNCDKVVIRLTGVGEREFSTKEIYEAIDKLQQPTLKPTTEINIDYYNELKAKVEEHERLARIGRATEKAFEYGGELEINIETHGWFYCVEDLIDWAESEGE